VSLISGASFITKILLATFGNSVKKHVLTLNMKNTVHSIGMEVMPLLSASDTKILQPKVQHSNKLPFGVKLPITTNIYNIK